MRVRAHDTKLPVLKTLFRFMVPPPKSVEYTYANHGLERTENMALTLLVYDLSFLTLLFSPENWPDYVIRYTINEDEIHCGYMHVDDVKRAEWETRENFSGCVVTIELDPMYDKAAVYEDLYRLLRTIGEAYAAEHELVVEWDEKYAYLGAHIDNMEYKQQAPTPRPAVMRK